MDLEATLTVGRFLVDGKVELRPVLMSIGCIDIEIERFGGISRSTLSEALERVAECFQARADAERGLDKIVEKLECACAEADAKKDVASE